MIEDMLVLDNKRQDGVEAATEQPTEQPAPVPAAEVAEDIPF